MHLIMLVKCQVLPLPSPHLAVLQCQLKHLCSAAKQAHPQAVQHHSLAAVEHSRGEVLGLQATDEPPEAGGDSLLRGRVLHYRVLGRGRESCCESQRNAEMR